MSCSDFLKNPTVNPFTKRKIKKDSKTYQMLMSKCKSKSPSPKLTKKRSSKKIKSPPSKTKTKATSKSRLVSKKEQCEAFFVTPDINPFTNRKIKKSGPKYKELMLECAEYRSSSPKKAKSSSPKWNQKLREYILFLQNDLMNFLSNSNPLFSTVIAGGYGLKTLIEDRYNIKGKVETSDVDITVSGYNPTTKQMTDPLLILNRWKQLLTEFIDQQPDSSLWELRIINLNGDIEPATIMKKYYLMMLKYKGEDFSDVVITNAIIHPSMIDIPLSNKHGFPMKKEALYLKELFRLLYIENVRFVAPYQYAKRNPITGKFQEKGQKDLERTQFLCEIKQTKEYDYYCNLLKEITIQQLRGMSGNKRSRLFESILQPLFK
jgi:hypothetical protein